MTIWEKFCGEINDRLELLIEKNRISAVKNRLKLCLAQQNKQLERAYMQIGRTCFENGWMSDDPQMESDFRQVEELREKIERLRQKLEAADTCAEDNVIAVDFTPAGGEPEASYDEGGEDAEDAPLPEEDQWEEEPAPAPGVCVPDAVDEDEEDPILPMQP